ncbi:DUF5979 domain-containing protein, partial [Pseudactinotalea sp.]|uniref:DUF5979 domain-containing protein n=1 Tax=Pseudactinotalea sp. TaxID=1926260 RepID=UPI003B3B45DB
AGTTVQPNLTSTARDELRDGSGPPAPVDGDPVTYTNTATTEGTGLTPGGQQLSGTDEDTGEASVIIDSGTGPTDIAKEWNEPFVDSQSSQERSTTLSWSVAEGFESVTITDPAEAEDASNPEDTVFQAFDLVAVDPITASSEPFSNGWWLRYDTITALQLYDGDAWVTVTEPLGGWLANGAFVGYQLSGPQQASTIGVRLVLEENTAAREAATQPGDAFDPFAPAPGSGVGASSAPRTFDLTWRIRDIVRIGDAFVTADELYNTADAGVVNNTVRLDAVTSGGQTQTDTDGATIVILDQPPSISVDKSVTPEEVLVPPADSPIDAYPAATFVIAGSNDSTARASYVRLTDPAPCGDSALSECATPNTAAGATSDPFAGVTSWSDFQGSPNPFDRFDIESVTVAASIPAEVDLAASTVWLLRYSGGAFASEAVTADQLNAGAIDLSDVVGLSVAFQGTDPATTGGTITAANGLTITIETRVRATIRSTGADQALDPNDTVDVTNVVFGQSYDPVTAEPDAQAIDSATDTITLSGGTIDVGASKDVDPSELIEPMRDAPVTVTLGADSGTSTLSPITVTLEDQSASPEFWNVFNFTGLGEITAPAGADRVQVDLYGAFDGGAPAWVSGSPSDLAAPSLPVAAASYPDVQGIRVTFSAADGGLFSDTLPAPAWTAAVELTVELRESYRDGSGPVPMEGSIDNTVTTQSNGALASSEEATADATITLSAGTQELAVNKLANNGTHFVSPGAAVPFRLQLQNVGTGYLTLTEVRDLLPPELLYLTDPATEVTTDPAGTVSDNVTITQEGQELIFTWPDGENVMQPGELVEIIVYLELQPVAANVQVTNTLVVTTVEELESCSNIVDGGIVTDDWEQDPATCGTTDYVEPTPGPNLFTVKAVRGELDGAINPSNPEVECRTVTTEQNGTFYRSPCAANSVIGGVDDWLLYVANAGTTNIDELTIFDQLPILGDQRLVDGLPRGSEYSPVLFEGSLGVVAPEGTTITTEVTVSEGACVGTWSTVQTAPVCEQNGETWILVEPGAVIDWDSVTGVRATFDFTTSTAGALVPGQHVEVTASTLNVPATSEYPSGADVSVPADDQFAWNQFGVKYRSAGDTDYRKIAPAVVGVHLLYGPIEISKEVTGPLTQYAADTFTVNVTCTIAGVEIDMGAHDAVELSAANDFTHRIDGIPVGAECEVTEAGELGSYGESSREGLPSTVVVELGATESEVVPQAQLVTLTNVYDATGLSVTKRVDPDGGPGSGTFAFSLTCESILGSPVVLDDDGATSLAFSIAVDETFTVPENQIPIGATCTVTETDAGDALATAFSGPGVTDQGDGVATVSPGTSPVEVVAVNTFEIVPPTTGPTPDPSVEPTPDPSAEPTPDPEIPALGLDVGLGAALAALLLLAGAIALIVRRSRIS